MQTPPLPLLLAGPIIRHVASQQLTLWLVCSEPVVLHVKCFHEEKCIAEQIWQADHQQHIQLGKHAHVHLLSLQPLQPFPANEWISYDIGLQIPLAKPTSIAWLKETAPQILYDGLSRPSLIITTHIHQLLQGSCRKPHSDSDDAMWVVDDQLALARETTDKNKQPALLLLSGDQIYADDVAAPMLYAIHQVIKCLGLQDEMLTEATVADSQALYASTDTFYRRSHLLPNTKANITLRERFFAGTRKPIFTTVNADNHLITLAEVMAMYLLVWSPVLWRYILLEKSDVITLNIATALQQRYETERICILHFASKLNKVQRALANVPVYMIFDDHDITDDWNLTRGWEESAYGHPFSRRIIGNALIAYAVFQGWGNGCDCLPNTIINRLQQLTDSNTEQTERNFVHNTLITELLAFEGWQYSVATRPKLVVLDTRTRRWRSERTASRPSGLMDWEALTDLQQQLINETSVILVSPAPIFGVKLIEVIQRIFTWFGHALTVDAENWMSHPGAANVILNIFRHKRTPHHFVILSGDVHYSFVYDVHLRGHKESPHIWQITSSGIKNTFPSTLLRVFDRLNRWLFASHSPLNWLTRRRHMKIRPRRPSPHRRRYRHQRLVNGSNIGRVRFDETGVPIAIEVLMADGECIAFTQGYKNDWVH